MQKLVHGLHQFQTTYFRSQRELFERLAKGQHPETLFITCSDSRINPNLLTQTEPGELFVMRNIGNIVPLYGASDSGEAAVIEYAVAVLGVKDVIICGHSHCGAMTGLLDLDSLDELPMVKAWLGHAEETLRLVHDDHPDLEGPERLTATVEENVLVQLEHLRTHPVVAARLPKGQIHLHGWVYEIETGDVFAYDPAEDRFVRLEAGPRAPLPGRDQRSF